MARHLILCKDVAMVKPKAHVLSLIMVPVQISVKAPYLEYLVLIQSL